MADEKNSNRVSAKAYERARELARNGGLEARRTLARNEATKPEVLYYLAADSDPSVRAAAARNESTPHHADLLLAKDSDQSIRENLAHKIARLMPNLSEAEQSTLYQATVDTLEVLVRDQMTQVRAILSEALKDVANAPPSVIRKLAEDTEISVSAPVLEFSPVLSDQDLIEIINSAPVQGALNAISRRTGLHEPVSDAIVDNGNESAIAELLMNRSAQIREETLDRIVESAPAIETWHAPLVRRPNLPLGPAKKIAGFVAQTLLTELRERSDLNPDCVAAITEVMESKLGKSSAQIWGDDQSSETAADESGGKPDESFAAQRVRAMIKRGQLTEDELFEALQSGDRLFVVAALAIRAEIPEETVHHALRLHSAKGIVAIVWKAGFSMHTASAVQLQLAGIPPKAMLKARGDGSFPMDEQDMLWQLEFLSGSNR